MKRTAPAVVFLRSVLPDEVESWRSLWILRRSDGRKVSRYFRTSEDMSAALDRVGPRPENLRGVDIYVGAAVYSRARSEHQRARIGDVLTVPSIRAEFDPGEQGNPSRLEDLVRHVLELPIRPTAIVGSGRGVHAWWRLREPASPAEAAPLIRGLDLWGADPAALDLPRVLRVPGTWNFKDPAHPLRLLHFEPDREVHLKAFAELGVHRWSDHRPGRPHKFWGHGFESRRGRQGYRRRGVSGGRADTMQSCRVPRATPIPRRTASRSSCC